MPGVCYLAGNSVLDFAFNGMIDIAFNDERALSPISFEIPTKISSQLDVKKCVNFKICG